MTEPKPITAADQIMVWIGATLGNIGFSFGVYWFATFVVEAEHAAVVALIFGLQGQRRVGVSCKKALVHIRAARVRRAAMGTYEEYGL